MSEAAAAIENTYINIAWREEDFAAVRVHAESRSASKSRWPIRRRSAYPHMCGWARASSGSTNTKHAEAALRKAVEIAESKDGAPLQRHQFTALAQLAGLLVVRGKPSEARDFATRAIVVGEATRGADAPMLVRPLQYLASAQLALGELPEALRTYERAGALLARYPNDIERPWIVAHYRGLARLQLALGEPAQARVSSSRRRRPRAMIPRSPSNAPRPC